MAASRPPNGKALRPFGNAIMTLSPLSTVTTERADLIFRCQSCTDGLMVPEAFVGNTISSWIIASDTLPDYIGNTTLAILQLAGAEISYFTLNVAAARFENFREMVHAAGFND